MTGGFGNRGANQTGMRARNERLVLSLLRRRGALAKAEIARITGLSAQTVSVIMRGLENDGFLTRGQKIRGRIGQPSVPMKLAPDGAYFFGLKLGRRSADLLLVDFLGNVISRVHRTYRYPTPEGTVAFARSSVEKLARELTPEQRGRISGLGIAMPFFIWEWASITGIDDAEMADWRDRDIRSEIAAHFDFPVFSENDATSACGAELVFGAHGDLTDFLYFYFGYFIGGGVVLGSRLYTGPTGNAGAMGPVPMPGAGAPGRQLIDVASLAGLETLLVASGASSRHLWESAESWEFDAAILGQWIGAAAPAIAHGIVAAVSIIDFPSVVVDGWLPEDVRGDLVAAIDRSLDDMNLSGLLRPRILEGSVGPDARALGAASLPLSRRFMPEV